MFDDLSKAERRWSKRRLFGKRRRIGGVLFWLVVCAGGVAYAVYDWMPLT